MTALFCIVATYYTVCYLGSFPVEHCKELQTECLLGNFLSNTWKQLHICCGCNRRFEQLGHMYILYGRINLQNVMMWHCWSCLEMWRSWCQCWLTQNTTTMQAPGPTPSGWGLYWRLPHLGLLRIACALECLTWVTTCFVFSQNRQACIMVGICFQLSSMMISRWCSLQVNVVAIT